MCPSYYAHGMGIGKATLYKARQMALDGVRQQVHGCTGMTYRTKAGARSICTAFWRIYFGEDGWRGGVMASGCGDSISLH